MLSATKDGEIRHSPATTVLDDRLLGPDRHSTESQSSGLPERQMNAFRPSDSDASRPRPMRWAPGRLVGDPGPSEGSGSVLASRYGRRVNSRCRSSDLQVQPGKTRGLHLIAEPPQVVTDRLRSGSPWRGESEVRFWMGTEWQDFCMLLLRKRYDDHTLHEMPDRHLGDLGLEAFTHDGCCFQCYAAEEPLDTKDLYQAQRDKLTADLGKLRKNAAAISKALGEVKISKYVFMVPRHESRMLVEHAATKAAEVRGWGLAFIADDFRVVVVTDDYYAAEREAIAAIPEQLVQADEIGVPEVEAWHVQNQPLVAGAIGKLRGVGLDGAALDRYVEALLTQYLEGENALEKLRTRYPEHWLTVSLLKSAKEKRLALEYPETSAGNAAVILKVAGDLAAEVQRDAPGVSQALAEKIAWAAVADWLMRCPLRLPISA